MIKEAAYVCVRIPHNCHLQLAYIFGKLFVDLLTMCMCIFTEFYLRNEPDN